MLLRRRIQKRVAAFALSFLAACQPFHGTGTSPVAGVSDSTTSAKVREAGRADSADTVTAGRDSIAATEQRDTTSMSWGRRVLWFYTIVGLIGMTVMAYALSR